MAKRTPNPWETDEWVEGFDEPEEAIMSGREIRARLKRGDTLVAQYSMAVPAYGRLGEAVQVKRFEEFVVSAVGSGKGPDEVVALGRMGRDISIPPWHVASFDVVRASDAPQRTPHVGYENPARRGLVGHSTGVWTPPEHLDHPPVPEGTTTHEGAYYFPTYQAAKAYAAAGGWPADRILEYGRGFAIQYGKGGHYAGPHTTPRMSEWARRQYGPAAHAADRLRIKREAAMRRAATESAGQLSLLNPRLRNPADRDDPRYVDDGHPSGVLEAWVGHLPMGRWTDSDADAFREAVQSELRYALGADAEANYDDIEIVPAQRSENPGDAYDESMGTAEDRARWEAEDEAYGAQVERLPRSVRLSALRNAVADLKEQVAVARRAVAARLHIEGPIALMHPALYATNEASHLAFKERQLRDVEAELRELEVGDTSLAGRAAAMFPNPAPDDHLARLGLLPRHVSGTVSADEIKTLMRKHGLTIKALAQRMDITQKRVREVRRDGTSSGSALDFLEAITGDAPQVAYGASPWVRGAYGWTHRAAPQRWFRNPESPRGLGANPRVIPHGDGFVIEFRHRKQGQVLWWRGAGKFKNVRLGLKHAMIFGSEDEARAFVRKEAVPYVRRSMSDSWEDQIDGWDAGTRDPNPEPGRRRNTRSSRQEEKARELYRRFTDQDSSERSVVTVDWPENPVEIPALEVSYRSDKWGRNQDYYHPFEGGVVAVVDASHPIAKAVEGTPKRVKLDKPPGTATRLADVVELVVEDGSGHELVFDYDEGSAVRNGSALLGFEHDGRATLVLNDPAGAVVLRGGGLEIRPEGLTG